MRSCGYLTASAVRCGAVLLLLVSAAAGWEPDRRLTFNDSTSTTCWTNAYSIAVSGDTVIVSWDDGREHTKEVYYKRSTNNGATWEADSQLTAGMASSVAPSITASGSCFHTAWQDFRDESEEIYYNRSTDAGATWFRHADFRISNADGFSRAPAVAAAGSSVQVVWYDRRDENMEIYHRRSTDFGATWGMENRLTKDSFDSYYPAIAMSGNNVHLVWWDTRDGSKQVYYKRSTDAGGAWDPDLRLSTDSVFSVYPSIAVQDSLVHVVWYDRRDLNEEIYYKRSTDNGTTWGPDTRLTSQGSNSQYPSLAAVGPMLHLIWLDRRAGEFDIYYKSSTDAGETWETDTRLTFSTGESWFPTVAAYGGSVHIAWYDARDGNTEIYYKNNVPAAVKERAGSRAVRARVVPNPFSGSARVPGLEQQLLSVHDAGGRRVALQRGDRLGERLPPGVYLIRTEAQDGLTLRLVKLE